MVTNTQVSRSWRRLTTMTALVALAGLPACTDMTGIGGPVARSAELSAAGDAPDVSVASFSDVSVEAFGKFGDTPFVRIHGRFSGSTTLGGFHVPFEIVAPESAARSSGTVVLEPPHFFFGTPGRDLLLGSDLLFEQGIAHATVGFGTNLFNTLDPSAPDIVVAGLAVPPPVPLDLGGVVDEEILLLFAHALTSTTFGRDAVGSVERLYAYGVSQSAAAVMEMLFHPDGAGLFDFSLLYVAMWRPWFQQPGVFDRQDGEFQPPEDAGKVIFVAAEGDQINSDSEQFRRVVGEPGFRLYEVAGAAHQPTAANPLDHLPIERAMFVAGDAWVRDGSPPPQSRLLANAPAGTVDPVYPFLGVTGIARDGDLNAVGGVRLPDLRVGLAQYVAADFTLGLIPGLNGASIDLRCAPRPDSDGPRFPTHGSYVGPVNLQIAELVRDGFMLPTDAKRLREAAGQSEVGMPNSC